MHTTQFSDISTCPETFTSGTMLARLAEVIGFRYYWATDGLSESDLSYNMGNGGRTVYEILDHLYNMMDFVGSTLEGKVYPFPERNNGYSFADLRAQTLTRIEEVRQHAERIEGDTLPEKLVQITVGDNPMEFNNWYMLNPLMDVMSHIGQVLALRRANGNPIDAGVQPFFGKRMEA